MSQERASGELSEGEVLRILNLIDRIEQSEFGYMRLEVGDLKLVVSKTGAVEAAVLPAPAPSGAAMVPATRVGGVAPAAAPVAAAVTAPAPAAAVAQAQAQAAAAAAVDQDLVTIPAPMIGKFYAQPEPGAPPFVTLNAAVTEDTTVGLIEVMKVYNAVIAGVRGVIAEVCVADGQFIEYGQPLFRVRPARD